MDFQNHEKLLIRNTGNDCSFCPFLPLGENWVQVFQKIANRDYPQHTCKHLMDTGYMQVLLVEDDERIVDFVQRGLKSEAIQ